MDDDGPIFASTLPISYHHKHSSARLSLRYLHLLVMVVVVGVVPFASIRHDHLATIRIAAHDTHVFLAGHNHEDLAFRALDLFALLEAFRLFAACVRRAPAG